MKSKILLIPIVLLFVSCAYALCENSLIYNDVNLLDGKSFVFLTNDVYYSNSDCFEGSLDFDLNINIPFVEEVLGKHFLFKGNSFSELNESNLYFNSRGIILERDNFTVEFENNTADRYYLTRINYSDHSFTSYEYSEDGLLWGILDYYSENNFTGDGTLFDYDNSRLIAEFQILQGKIASYEIFNYSGDELIVNSYFDNSFSFQNISFSVRDDLISLKQGDYYKNYSLNPLGFVSNISISSENETELISEYDYSDNFTIVTDHLAEDYFIYNCSSYPCFFNRSEPSCNDGFWNGDEEYTDCGGSCESCASCIEGNSSLFNPAYVLFHGLEYGDSCKDNNTLIENYCGINLFRWDFWNINEKVAKNKEVVCDMGCFNGACLENPEIPPQNNTTDLPEEPAMPRGNI